MPRKRYDPDPKRQLNEYINTVIDNVTLDGELTTEQKTRELTILSLTLLTARPKTLTASS